MLCLSFFWQSSAFFFAHFCSGNLSQMASKFVVHFVSWAAFKMTPKNFEIFPHIPSLARKKTSELLRMHISWLSTITFDEPKSSLEWTLQANDFLNDNRRVSGTARWVMVVIRGLLRAVYKCTNKDYLPEAEPRANDHLLDAKILFIYAACYKENYKGVY